MLTNPFIEGIALLLVGIACLVSGHLISNAADLSQLGATLTGGAMGYVLHAAVVQPPPAPK